MHLLFVIITLRKLNTVSRLALLLSNTDVCLGKRSTTLKLILSEFLLNLPNVSNVVLLQMTHHIITLMSTACNIININTFCNFLYYWCQVGFMVNVPALDDFYSCCS